MGVDREKLLTALHAFEKKDQWSILDILKVLPPDAQQDVVQQLKSVLFGAEHLEKEGLAMEWMWQKTSDDRALLNGHEGPTPETRTFRTPEATRFVGKTMKDIREDNFQFLFDDFGNLRNTATECFDLVPDGACT